MTSPEPPEPAAPGARDEPAPAPPRHPRTSDELRLVFEQAPVAIWSVDGALRFTYTRVGDLVRLRNALGDCHGMTLAERLGSDDPDGAIVRAHRRALAGEIVNADFEFDGRAYHAHLEPMRDESGAIVGVIGVGVDHTDERASEAAIRESEERYRRLAEFSPEAIVVHAEGRLLYANPAAARILGYDSVAEVLRANMFDFFPPEDHDSVRQRMHELYVARRATELNEWRVLSRDGSLHIMEFASTPIVFEGREATITATRDITERRRAEEALRSSHALLDAIVRGTTDAIWVKDLEGRYLMVNDAGARATGRAPGEIVGATDFELFPPEAAELFRRNDQRVLDAGATMTFEEDTVVGGQRRVWHTTRGVYRDGKGDSCGVIGVAREVTQLRRLEEQLRRSQKIEAVGRLAGGIAHDFNNLLAIIKSYADFLVQSIAPDDARHDDVEEIRAAADRAAALTRQLLVFSRRQVVAPEALDLNRVVTDMERMLRPLLIHGVELRLALAPELWPARADAGQMEQVLLNLAVNARDAMPDGGLLTVGTANVALDEPAARALGELRPGEYVEMLVRDTGTGMDETTLAHIFEPFFTTKPPGQGTGLGLPTVYAIVQAAGGHVDIESAPGAGTTVRVLLPRMRGDEEEDEERVEAPRPRQTAATILVVDDDPQWRAAMARLLEEEGYTVFPVAEAGEAMRLGERHGGAIDLLVADDLMPTMSGSALAGQLAARRPNLRVLLVSSLPRAALEDHHLLPPHARTVPRTATPDELVAAVRETLAAPLPRAEPR